VLVTDHDWRVSHATASARDLLEVDEPAGTALFGLVHPLDITPLATALSLLTYSGSSISLDLRIRCRDGWRPIAVTAGALCSHTPPRLVWLLSVHPSWQGDEYLAANDDRIEAAILALITRAGGRAEFSDRELEIIARSLRGQGAAEIAREMFLNRGTVRNALTRIYRKVGVRSQIGLVAAVLAGRAGERSTTTAKIEDSTAGSSARVHPEGSGASGRIERVAEPAPRSE
jgi:DNA-binding CsgD family transcriptional regulator